MMDIVRSALVVGAIAITPITASAATISVSILDATSYNGTFGLPNTVTETFEELGDAMGEGEVGGTLSTDVGDFDVIAGSPAGSGGTVTQLPDNDGLDIALRDGNVFGRTNVTPAGGEWFLDSNDTWGMVWTVGLAGGRLFDSIAFTLMDGNDAGAHLRITTGDDTFETRTADGGIGNGNAKLVTIDFGGLVSSATIELGNYTTSGGEVFKLNDGFSVDGMQVFADPEINEVPLPAGMVLLGTALAGLGLARRRKAA